MNFRISPPCRTFGVGDRVEIVVEQGDDVVPRPMVGKFRETPQVVNDDRCTYRRAGAPSRGAGEDMLARMGPT